MCIFSAGLRILHVSSITTSFSSITAHKATSGKCIAMEINTGSDIGGFDRHLGMKEQGQSWRSRYKARQTGQTWTGLDNQDCLFRLFSLPIR